MKYESFVNGDTYASLGGTLGFDTPANSGSSVSGSPYTVTPKGLTSTNYTITFAAGKLAVTPAPLTVAANDKQKVDGGALPSFTVKPAAFVNGDTYASLGGTLAFLTTASQTSTVAEAVFDHAWRPDVDQLYHQLRRGQAHGDAGIAYSDRAQQAKGVRRIALSVHLIQCELLGLRARGEPLCVGRDVELQPGSNDTGSSYSNPPQGLTSSNYAITFAPGQLTILAWTLAGFYQPVDMSTGGLVYNTVKGGSTVPLKFDIFQATQPNTNERTDVAAVKSFSATPFVCKPATMNRDRHHRGHHAAV